MSSSVAKLSVFVCGRQVCIKIAGRANFSSSIDFKTLVNELVDKGFTYFVLDLSECMLMDSTFLGVLAGFGLRMVVVSREGNGGSRSIELRNPNSRIAELLENLGVAHLFKIVNSSDSPNGDLTPTSPCAEPTRVEVTKTCLEAHETLMNISAANIPKFKDVAQFLAEDLKKSKVTS